MARWIVSGSHARYFTDVEIDAENEEEAKEKVKEHFADEPEDGSESEIGSIVRCCDDEAAEGFDEEGV